MSLTVPEWDKLGIPVDDDAEPEDAVVEHNIEQEEIDASTD